MKITLCLSIKFWQEMLQVQKELESLGHEVMTPPHEVPNDRGEIIPVEEYYKIRKDDSRGDETWIWDLKEKAIRAHFEKVSQADVILVLNYDKKGIKNYIGANTLLEMGLALWLNKRIFLLNPIPEELDYAEEIKGMMPIVINNDLENIL